MFEAFEESSFSRPPSHLHALVLHAEAMLPLIVLMLFTCFIFHLIFFFLFFASPIGICKALEAHKSVYSSQVIVIKNPVSEQTSACLPQQKLGNPSQQFIG